MGKLHCITIDCAEPARLSKFWGQALEGYSDDASGVIVRSESGPIIYFQQVPEPKTVKNRVHIDIGVPDVQPEVERLTALGAKPVRAMEEGGMAWTIMADPEGNEFCVCKA
jgi:predicted enzyme related to lactoylglutathione lyase